MIGAGSQDSAVLFSGLVEKHGLTVGEGTGSQDSCGLFPDLGRDSGSNGWSKGLGEKDPRFFSATDSLCDVRFAQHPNLVTAK